jgi:hypothetical protein
LVAYQLFEIFAKNDYNGAHRWIGELGQTDSPFWQLGAGPVNNLPSSSNHCQLSFQSNLIELFQKSLKKSWFYPINQIIDYRFWLFLNITSFGITKISDVQNNRLSKIDYYVIIGLIQGLLLTSLVLSSWKWFECCKWFKLEHPMSLIIFQFKGNPKCF